MSNTFDIGTVCRMTRFPVIEKMVITAPASLHISEFPDRMILGADIADRPEYCHNDTPDPVGEYLHIVAFSCELSVVIADVE
jgi:hypothetical protein